jgi:NADPH-dependent 2,4-dienoyl-CoA reductase/sulfur reductase-like enzyme
MRLLIIGGSDAGITAALRARELDSTTEVTVVVADSFPNYSICGLPFFLSGEVSDWHTLAHRTADEIERKGVHLWLNHTAQSIDPEARSVTVVDQQGRAKSLSYDRLIIATGATSVNSTIPGSGLPGVHQLHSMADTFHMQKHLLDQAPRSAIIVGGGYIGLEMADALTHRGIKEVNLVVRSASVLRSTLSTSVARVVEQELRRCGVKITNGIAVEAIERTGERLTVMGTRGFKASADLVLVAVGVRPATTLARSAGITTGLHGAIRVNREMATNIPDIYAAGDCVETWHHLLRTYTYLPLGTTAHKQGRIAGENAVGGHRQFAGSLGTQVVKVFDLAVARTGLLEDEASATGYEPVGRNLATWDHKVYYPGARKLLLRIIGDQRTGQLLGGQIVGPWQAEVAKRIDTLAVALSYGMTVEALNDLDLSYAPPFSSPWDPVQMAAQGWTRGLAG